MKVGYLVSQYPAASHTFIRREVEFLRQSGVLIETFSIRPPSSAELISARDQQESFRTYYLLPPKPIKLLKAHLFALCTRPGAYVGALKQCLGHRVPGIQALAWALFHFAEAIELADELRRRRISHLHNHFANSGATVGFLASNFLKIPWSLTLHGISETDYPAGLLLSKKIEAASLVACVSEFGRAQAMRLCAPQDWSKLLIVRCALELDEMPPKVPHDPASPVRVICVARLSPEKGHFGLLESFAGILKRGLSAELVLVGDGPQRRAIESRVHELGITAQVRLAGLLSEADTLSEIARSDIMVLASFMEGLPVVLMEGMACGLPVIATRVAGIPELVIDEANGLLFNPSNWNQLEDRLARLVADEPLRQKLGKAAKAAVSVQHNMRAACEPLVGFFKGPGG